jgi:predicted aspartyl protease
MTYSFDPAGRLVVVPVFVSGPRGGENFTFAVDTGATRTAISELVLTQLGYRQSDATGHRQARTGSGGTRAHLIPVSRLSAFGRERSNYPVLWLPIPPTSRIDGLLGLDFFRGLVLTLDFARGRVSLAPPKKWWQIWR